jgi:uncharacterized membrane protein
MKHHYVPASYLRLFVDPATPHGQQPFVWIADFESGKMLRKAPENFGYIRDHNLVFDESGQSSNSAELMLSELESNALPVIRRIVAGDMNVRDANFRALNAFVALQWVRTPAVRDRLEDFFLSAVRKLAAMMTIDPDVFKRQARRAIPDLSDTDAERAYEFARDSDNYEISVHSSRALGDALNLAGKAEPILAQMTWFLVVAAQPVFVTSDNPVSVINPKLPSWNMGHGLSNADTEVTFPLNLSPNVQMRPLRNV